MRSGAEGGERVGRGAGGRWMAVEVDVGFHLRLNLTWRDFAGVIGFCHRGTEAQRFAQRVVGGGMGSRVPYRCRRRRPISGFATRR